MYNVIFSIFTINNICNYMLRCSIFFNISDDNIHFVNVIVVMMMTLTK